MDLKLLSQPRSQSVLTLYADHEAKPNEHPGTLRSNLPRKWANLEAIMDFTVG